MGLGKDTARVPGRWLRAALCGLILALAAAPAARAQGHEDGDGKGPGGPAFFQPRVLKALNLTPDQVRKFKAYKLDLDKKKIQLRGEREIAELDLRNALSSYPVKADEVRKLEERIADIQGRAVKLRLEALLFFLQNLNESQHRKFTELQAEMEEKRQQWADSARADRPHRWRHGEDGGDGQDGAGAP